MSAVPYKFFEGVRGFRIVPIRPGIDGGLLFLVSIVFPMSNIHFKFSLFHLIYMYLSTVE
jgi:hypothetical protein